MSAKLSSEIEECVRNNVPWPNLPSQLKQILKNTQKSYERYVFNYSLKNQLRYRGNLVRKIFRNEQRYYELLVDKSVSCLCLFPYHLADIVTKGLRVTPFNYYLDVLSYLLKNDKSYDTLPNFTAADCLRVLGIGRNEYLVIVSELKTNSSKLFRKPSPLHFLPKFPVRIHVEPWWKIEVGYVLESDVKFVTIAERSLIDDLIDFGSQTTGIVDYNVIHNLYRKGLVYLDVPISGEDVISIPPLKNFVMNRVSGDYFENLLYKIFVSADEHTTISELSQMLQLNLDLIKHAISLFCRLGFAKKKNKLEITSLHKSWKDRQFIENEKPQITPLNYHSLLNETNEVFLDDKGSMLSTKSIINKTCANILIDDKLQILSTSTEYISSSDGNNSDFSFINNSNNQETKGQSKKSESPNDFSSEIEEILDPKAKMLELSPKKGKRVGFLFDSTLTAFLMMGNLSPGLKNHAVTMFEVGKLCEESMETFLSELEKVSLLDAEGEGEASRYFAHAVILRSTIISLRNVLNSGLDLLRLECLENLDYQTRDRLLEKKYKFIISATPLSGALTNLFSIPFFGQFYKSSDNSHIWSKLFYYHMSGYGPPSLFLIKGTILKSLPRIFLGYGKLSVTIVHTDSYVINSENFQSLNDQLKNGCILLQGYGIRQPGVLRYEAFPFDKTDSSKRQWSRHKAVERLSKIINLEQTCGYITFVNTGVPDIGCEDCVTKVILAKPKTNKRRNSSDIPQIGILNENFDLTKASLDCAITEISNLNSPIDCTEITSFNINKTLIDGMNLSSPVENYFAVTPITTSPSNEYRSADCNELLAKELKKLDGNLTESEDDNKSRGLVLQNSIEIPIEQKEHKQNKEYKGEEWTILDVNFGLPLFDVDCNTRICQYIIKTLSTNEHLTKLPKINAGMNEKFMTFISQCLYFKDENMEIKRIGKLVPKPRINLAFENGKICFWNGK